MRSQRRATWEAACSCYRPFFRHPPQDEWVNIGPTFGRKPAFSPLKSLTCVFVRDCSVVLILRTMLQNIQTAVIFIPGGGGTSTGNTPLQSFLVVSCWCLDETPASEIKHVYLLIPLNVTEEEVFCCLDTRRRTRVKN